MSKKNTQPFAQRTTKSSRRAAERRAAEHRAAQERALAAAPTLSSLAALEQRPQAAAPDAVVSGPARAPRGPRSPRPSKNPRPRLRLAVYSFLTALALMVTLTVATPLLGAQYDTPYLVVGSLAFLGAAERVIHWARRVPALLGVLLPGVAAVLVGLFLLGAANQVTIDGKVYLSTSDTAKAYELSQDVYADLLVLRDNDRYLGLPAEQARSYADEVQAAATQAQEVADRWNPSSDRELPSPAFSPVLRDLNASADYQAQALRDLSDELNQPDAARAARIDTARRYSVESFVAAVNELRQAGNLYGFDPTYTEGPVE